MPRISKKTLLDGVKQAIGAAGYRVTLLSRPSDHPMRLAVRRGENEIVVRVYIWALTHGGGRARPAHEQRIQITSGVNQFQIEEGEKTLVLGWSPAFGVYAAFDVTRHRGRLGASPSMQIGQSALVRAHEVGAAIHLRRGDEIAIAVQPALLAGYISRMERLHHKATASAELELLRTEDMPLPGAAGDAETDAHQALTEIAAGSSPRFGAPEEQRQRQEILDRIAALERKVALGEAHNSLMGHNQPPEPIEQQARAETASALNEVQGITQDLTKTPPDVSAVAQKTTRLSRITKQIRSAIDRANDRARSMGKYIQSGIVALTAIEAVSSSSFLGWIFDNLLSILSALSAWIKVLF